MSSRIPEQRCELLRGRRAERGVAMIAAIIGVILIGSAVASLYMLSRQAELSAQPRSQQAQLQSFAGDSVRFCGRVLRVLAGQDPDGILDIDTLVTAINSDPDAQLSITLAKAIDPTRAPVPVTMYSGDNAIEQEFTALLNAGNDYSFNAAWLLDRTGSTGRYQPGFVLRRGSFEARVDLDPVGPDATGAGSGGGCDAVVEWGSGVGGGGRGGLCGGGGGDTDAEAEAAGNPVASVMAEDYLYRCRVDAFDRANNNKLVVDAIIRR